MIKVLIVDDHASMREALATALTGSGEFIVVGEVSNGKAYVDIKIIVMTAFDEITYIPRAKAAGANGFVYKSKSLNYFLEVVKEVLAGGSSFPEPKTIPMPQGEAPLTEREMEVLRLMCRHMTNKEIARELFISENTVKYHKMNMLGKTGFSKAKFKPLNKCMLYTWRIINHNISPSAGNRLAVILYCL